MISIDNVSKDIMKYYTAYKLTHGATHAKTVRHLATTLGIDIKTFKKLLDPTAKLAVNQTIATINMVNHNRELFTLSSSDIAFLDKWNSQM